MASTSAPPAPATAARFTSGDCGTRRLVRISATISCGQHEHGPELPDEQRDRDDDGDRQDPGHQPIRQGYDERGETVRHFPADARLGVTPAPSSPQRSSPYMFCSQFVIDAGAQDALSRCERSGRTPGSCPAIAHRDGPADHWQVSAVRKHSTGGDRSTGPIGGQTVDVPSDRRRSGRFRGADGQAWCGYATAVAAWNVSLIERGDVQRIRFAAEPALSLVPEARAPPKGCWPTTAPVGLSLM